MAARLHNSDKNSTALRKRIESHTFDDEEGDEYGASSFGGFPEYFRRKKIKLQNLDAELRAASDDCPPIFRGIVAHINGYTQPSLNDLHKLIVSHGGGFQQYLDGKTTVTHIIAANLTPKKRVEFRRYRIVKPAWVVDSIKAGRLLPWDDFRVIDEGKGQKVLGFDSGKVVSQKNAFQRGYRDQTDQSWYTSQVKGVVNDINDGFDEMPFPSTQPSSRNDYRRSPKVKSQGETTAAPPVTSSSEGGPMPPSQSSDVLRALADAEADSDLGKELSFSADNDSLGPSQGPAPDVSTLPQVVPENSPVPFATEVKESNATFDDDVQMPEETGEVSMAPPFASPLKRTRSTESSSPSKKAKITAEEHNTALLADPRMRKSSVLNPEFLKQYYSESRLHHLSNWKANLKSQIQQHAAEKSSSQRAREKRPPGSRRYILHVDFDSFFAAVSLKNAPHMKDKPVVVAHGSGPGSEIASCNYVARGFGVKNGMWMKRALDLCPDIQVLPYDFKAYEEASRHFYEAILATGGIVQSVSIDEALVDVTALCLPAGGSDGEGVQEGIIGREQAKADELAQGLRDRVLDKTGCAVSVGLGGSILLAKVALRKAKPAGQYHLKPEDVLDFIGELTVRDLPGVAHSIGGKLEEIGVTYVKDIRGLSKERLISTLGPKTGEKIWDYSRGIDRTEVGEQVIRKSVSAEVNWGVRFETQAQADEFICSLCEELHRRLVEQKVKGRQLTMKIMRKAADAPLDPPKNMGHGKCDVFNKSVVLGVATNAKEVLSREALSILKGHGFSPGELRGLGVQMTKLEPLKAVGEGARPVESSQKRLQFKLPDVKTEHRDEPPDPIQDDPVTPKKATKHQNAPLLRTPQSGSKGNYKRLNTLGTQFVLPSQIDPSVLAELPDDVRSKLVPASKGRRPVPLPPSLRPLAKAVATATSPTPSRSASPHKRIPLATTTAALFPSQSQLDPDTLAALPADLQAEILASYTPHQPASLSHSPSKPHMHPQQSLLPQSPRKPNTSRSKKLITTPTKKRPSNTLTQSNFLFPHISTSTATSTSTTNPSNPTTGSLAAVATIPDPNADPDPAFLAALPPSIRQELLAERHRARLRALNLSRARSRTRKIPPPAPPAPKRVLRLPPRRPKPTFTEAKICALPQLRGIVSEWVREFEDEEGGPYDEDVDALGGYLERVVREEKDMGKAVGVVRWLGWVVGEIGDGKKGKDGWERARERVEGRVQSAVRERGLGDVVF